MSPSPSANDIKRLEAVKEILECNSMADSGIEAVFDVIKELMPMESASYTLIGELCVNIKKTNSSIIAQGTDIGPQALCYWTLVPEQAQVMIVEDMTKDARCLIDTKTQQFGGIRAAVLSNFAEILMWLLEGNVMRQRPASPILIGNVRGKQVYKQACALVDVSTAGWRIKYANMPFIAVAGPCVGALLWDLMQGSEGFEEALRGLQSDHPQPNDGVEMRNLHWKGQQSSKPLFAIQIRPASTSQLHEDANVLGNPSLPNEAADQQSSALTSLFFVLLTSAACTTAVARRTPIPHLVVGTALGAGDFAQVYRGSFNGQSVAIKIVKDPGAALSENSIPLEAMLLEGLSHPNVVGLQSWKLATTASGQQRLWLVLDYCNGGDLADAIDRGWFRSVCSQSSAPSSATILATIRDIAAGLTYLHSKDILHCDLSGGNVLLHSKDASSGQFIARVADFGFSRRRGIKSIGPRSGNYAYLAPEVMNGEPHTTASDIWSFGVLIYEMLAGQRAWEGLNHAQIAFAVLWEQIDLESGGEGFLQRLVKQCLKRKPTERPSAQLLLDLMEKEAAGRM